MNLNRRWRRLPHGAAPDKLSSRQDQLLTRQSIIKVHNRFRHIRNITFVIIATVIVTAAVLAFLPSSAEKAERLCQERIKGQLLSSSDPIFSIVNSRAAASSGFDGYVVSGSATYNDMAGTASSVSFRCELVAIAGSWRVDALRILDRPL